MAANAGTKNSMLYYKIADGMLYQNRNDVIDGFTKLEKEEIQKARDNFENIDLRGRYVERDSDKYRYKHYFPFIEGVVKEVKKEGDSSYGDYLKIVIKDVDGDMSEISTKFYGKYSSDILNRFCNTDFSKELKLWPFSIPSDYKTDKGDKVEFYQQGISVSDGPLSEDKKKWVYITANGLPPTERVKNPSDGTMMTSRVNRVDFLWEKVQDNLKTLENGAMQDNNFPEEPINTSREEPDFENDLPF